MGSGDRRAPRPAQTGTGTSMHTARPATRLARIAGALFAEKGYGATSIRDIAAAAGVAPSSVYSHFASKEAILVAHLNESSQAEAAILRSELLENAALPPDEQVAVLTGLAAERAIAQPGSSTLGRAELRRASQEPTTTARRMRSESAGFLADVIRHGQGTGDLSSTEPADELAVALLSVTNQAATWLRRWPVAPAPELVGALGNFARRIAVGSTTVDPVPLPRPLPTLGSSTRDRILRAAIEQIAANGYSGASIRDIARSVGISPASIYEHYASKEHLLAAVVDIVVRGRVEAAERALSRPAADDVVARLVALLRDVVGASVAWPELAIAADADFGHVPAAIAEPLVVEHRRMVAVLAGLVDEGRSDGRFHYDEPTSLAVFGVLALAIGAAWLVVESPGLDPTVVVAESVSYAVRLLGADLEWVGADHAVRR